MLLKLPILINGRKIDHNFKIKIEDDIIEITSLDNKKNVNIVCFNNGIYSKVIHLPMKFIIKNNYIFNEYFFYNFISEINKEDFFNKLLDGINNKKNKKFKFYKHINLTFIENIYECYDKKYQLIYNFNDINEFFNYTFYRVIYNLNKYLYIFYSNIVEENIVNNNKKTKSILASINNIKINFNNKEGIVESLICKENIKDIINHLIILKYESLVEIIINKIYKTNFYFHFYKYYLKNNIDYLIYLKLLNIDIIHIDNKYKTYFNDVLDISKENISFELFKMIINKDINYNKNILNNLFIICDKSSLIINKNKLSNTFKKILYYSYKFIKKINIKELVLSNKIRFIYNIIYDSLKKMNEKSNFINNKKIYEKSINTILFKIIFCNENIFDLDITILNNIIKNFNNNLVIYNISKNINYFYINYQTDYYRYIFNEINKNIMFDIQDSKIKEIIQKPYIILNNMNDKLSILKWLNIIKKYINIMFYQPIKMTCTDIINLSEILYYISKVSEQKLNNNYYRNLIFISSKFKNLLIYNDRINLKINDIFTNKNINLGYLVKNIKNNNIVVLYEENDYINKYKMKYLKYKGKYLLVNNY